MILYYVYMSENGETRKSKSAIMQLMTDRSGFMDKKKRESLFRAFAAHDKRFDGKIFVGVTTTGIYCRPVCAARMPKFENCIFFKSAAEAEQAGFRPCKTCRPELAPGDNSQDHDRIAHKTASYIEKNCSLNESMEDIAQRFGFSLRQLRRIFKEEFNVTMIEYQQTCRLLLAKKLLTETDLSVTEIAAASGFGSVRRLNETFREKYRMAPGELRKRKKKGSMYSGSIDIGIGYRPPYRWDELLDFLRLRAIDGVEYADEQSYSRIIRKKDKTGSDVFGWIRVRNVPDRDILRVEISESLMPVLSGVIDDVKRMFDTGCDPVEISDKLESVGKVCSGGFIEGTRLPGSADGFEICVRAVLGQQITVRAARTLAERFVLNFGVPVTASVPDADAAEASTGAEAPGAGNLRYAFPSASEICSLEGRIEDHLGPLGITASRARAIKAIAEMCEEGQIDWEKDEPEEVIYKLLQIRGIGPWTAKYIVMRAMSYPDVFLENDAGVKKGLAGLSAKEAAAAAEEWRPWRSYAVMNIWNSLS